MSTVGNNLVENLSSKLLNKQWWQHLLSGSNEDAATRPRFTTEELRSLYEVLQRNPVVNEGNKALVVETVRSIAEFMIWGDQNEPKIFDFFLENNVMVYLHRILQQPANRSGDVAKQVLQTLSIIIQNVRSETGIYFLFSNNHINNIVAIRFDFEDEEVLGFYISFLKAISLKLNQRTVQFFILSNGGSSMGGSPNMHFPLYSEAIKFAHHKEGMVRAGVRTLTLNVYSVKDSYIEALVTAPPASNYFADLAKYLAEQTRILDQRMQAAESFGQQALSLLDSEIAEVEDVLSYCSDIFSAAHPYVGHLLAEQLWVHVAGPLLFKPLLQLVDPALQAATGPAAVRPVTAMYLLERVFVLINYRPLLHNLITVLMAPAAAAASSGSAGGSDGLQKGCSVRAWVRPSPMMPGIRPKHESCRAAVCMAIRSNDSWLVPGTLRMLVSLAKCSSIAPALLHVLGLLPRKRRGQLPEDCTAAGCDLCSLSSSLAAQSSGAPSAAGMLPAVATSAGGPYHFGYYTVWTPSEKPSAVEAESPLSPAEPASREATPLKAAPAPSSQLPLSSSAVAPVPAASDVTASSSTTGGQDAAGSIASASAVDAPLISLDDDGDLGAGGGLGTAGAAAGAQPEGTAVEQPLIDLAGDAGSSLSRSVSRQVNDVMDDLVDLVVSQQEPRSGQQPESLSGAALRPEEPAQQPEAQQEPAPATAEEQAAQQAAAEAAAAALLPPPQPAEPSSSTACSCPVHAAEVSQAALGRHAPALDLLDALFSLLHFRLLAVPALCNAGYLISQWLPSSAGAAGSSSSPSATTATGAAPAPGAHQHPLDSSSTPAGSSSSSPAAAGSSWAYEVGEELRQHVRHALPLAAEAVFEHVQGMWGEAVFILLHNEWRAAHDAINTPLLRAASELLMTGPHLYPVLPPVPPGSPPVPWSMMPPARPLGISAVSALQMYHAVQRLAVLLQVAGLLRTGSTQAQAPVMGPSGGPDDRPDDLTEGQVVELQQDNAIPCSVSFQAGQERRVYLSLAGPAVTKRAYDPVVLASDEEARKAILHSSPAVVLAEPSTNRLNAGVVVSVAQLVGAQPACDPNVPKWLHVHVRASVKGLLRMLRRAATRKGGILSEIRILADGHWVLAFHDAERAANARNLVEHHARQLQAAYAGMLSEAINPLIAMALD